jgi:hypothetical protein
MSTPFDAYNEHFANLRPRAAEFGAIPALQLTDAGSNPEGAFIGLQQGDDKPGLALLVVHLADKQLRFVVELDGLQGLIDRPL